MSESDDGAAFLVDPRLTREPTPDVLGRAHRDRDARKTLLEGARPLLPERRELELGGPVEARRQRVDRDDARDAVDAHAGRPPGDQIPGAALEDETERIDGALDDVAALPVADPRA